MSNLHESRQVLLTIIDPNATMNLMKIAAPILIVVFTSTIGLLAQTPAKAHSAAEQELLKVEAEWYKAYLESDGATMNRLEGEDMIVFTPTSLPSRFLPMNKSRNMATRTAETKARMAATKRSLEKTQVRLLGDIGIVNAIQVEMRKDETGVEKPRKAFYTSVWARRKGIWQCVYSQFTEIPEANWSR